MKTTRKVMLVFLVLILGILSPWILGAVFFGGAMTLGNIDEWRYPQTSAWIPSRWRTDLKYRYSVVEEVISNRVKPGMSADEVNNLLGTPDRSDGMVWAYETKKPGWRFIDWNGGGVRVTFEGGKVSTVEDSRWVD